MISYRQGNKISNLKYLEIFCNKVEAFEMVGGESGTCVDRVNIQLAANEIDPNYASEDEIATAKTQAREEYLSVLFIKNCDPTHY